MSDRATDIGPLVLNLESNLSAVEEGRLALLDHLAPAALSPRVINRLEVVFEELVSNIARHGSASAIRVEAALHGGEVRIAVEDDGPAFDPFDAPEPAPYTDLATAVPGGQGIPLLKRLTSHSAYRRRDGRNCVTLAIAAA